MQVAAGHKQAGKRVTLDDLFGQHRDVLFGQLRANKPSGAWLGDNAGTAHQQNIGNLTILRAHVAMQLGNDINSRGDILLLFLRWNNHQIGLAHGETGHPRGHAL